MERRLAAILITDVVSYSRLMREDEAGTLKRLLSLRNKVMQPTITRHGGRIVKLMGDGILAEFPSVVEAVQCAVDIQQAIVRHEAGLPNDKRIKIRIGINLGDIIVAGSDIYGDGINVAARLEAIAEAGGVCISGTVFDHVKGKVNLRFENLGLREVKNISEPVRVYGVLSSSEAGSKGEHRLRSFRKGFRGAIVAAVAVGIIAAGVFLSKQPWTYIHPPWGGKPLPQMPSSPTSNWKGPSIAVLPFTNKSESNEQAFFADGITDDIITELTKVPGLLVISRDSTFNYRDRSPNLRKLARTLRVRYILQGSIRRSQDTVRINANLIEASSGRHIWGDRYDGNLADVFTFQDKITQKIVAALSLQLSAADQENLMRPETADLGAYELFLRGRDLFLRFSKENTYGARGLFEKALARDPKFARAYAMLAWTYAFEYTNGWSKTPEQTLSRSLDLADKALAINDRLPIAYFTKGLVFRARREYIEALAEAQKAINIDPNYANGYVLLATVLYYAGRPKEGLKMIEKAENINPVHPSNYPFHKGQALFILKRYDEAIKAFKNGLKQNPTSQRLRVWLAAAYAQVGQMEEAQWEAVQVLAEDPHFKLGRLPELFPFKDPEDLNHFNAALRKVGFENRW